MAVLIPVQIIIFAISFPPDTMEGWFELFHKNWFLGLLHLDLIYIIDNIMVAILYLAFYVILKHKNESLMTISILLGYLGIAAYFASNKAFEMLTISNQYYSAVGTDKEAYMAAGHMLIASWRGTAFDIYYVLNAIALLVISFVMLRSDIFSKKTAVVGLISGIFMIIPSTAGIIGLVFSLLSLIPWVVFLIMIAIRFMVLCKKNK
jgi:hypothetical protein